MKELLGEKREIKSKFVSLFSPVILNWRRAATLVGKCEEGCSYIFQC